MFKIDVCQKAQDCISRFWLFCDQERIGAISVYPSSGSKERGIIEIYIEESYRKRWLLKEFAKDIKSMVINTLKDKNIKEIRSKAISDQSPRLLAFFGFDRYNNVYYKLRI